MKIEQIYTGCLSQGAYYIESKGEVAIIDPLREVEPYLKRAKKARAKIKYIFETHFHADFVSGHVTLSKQTGAPIIYGPNAETNFEAIIASDGQEFKLGDVIIKVLHTPGHTMESSCYLLKDEHGKDYALFSGDTLFLGDVGRPDLAQKSADITQEDLAGLLYESLRDKIMPLSDGVLVYPAHGAGSACGKNLSKETVGTIGGQKENNYALRKDMTKEEFIKEVTDGLQPPPSYFPLNVKLNKEGYDDIDDVLQRGKNALSPDQFEELANATDAIILDVRHESEYVKGHIPRSIFIGIDGSFAPWVGDLIGDVKQKMLLVTPKGREEETITRLSRVGFDYTIGYLEGGLEAWVNSGKEIDTIESISANQFKDILAKKNAQVVDVRKPGEYNKSHIPEADLIPLSEINNHFDKISDNEKFYIHCGGGYRSVIAASILKSRGIHNLVDVAGGFADIKNIGIKITDGSCSSQN